MAEDHESPVGPVISPQDEKAQQEIIDKYGPLSVTDLLRHKLTGQLPEEIEYSLTKTLEDQTAPLRNPSPAKEIIQEEPPLISTEQDYKDFTSWSATLLTQLEGTLELADDAPTAFQNRITELEEQLAVFDKKATHHFAVSKNDDQYKNMILSKWGALSRQLRDRILEKQDDPHTKATLVSLLFHLESGAENVNATHFRVVSPIIDELLEKGEFECLGELLHKEKGVEKYTFRSLKDQRSRIHTLPKGAATTLLEPLISLASRTVKTNGLEGLNTIGIAYYIGDLVAQHSEELVQAIEQHTFPIVELQERFVNTLYDQFDKISGGYPSHSCMQDILVALLELYQIKPISSDTTCPATLKPLLQKLYVEKVVKYERKGFDYFFNRLSAVTGIPLQEMKSSTS